MRWERTEHEMCFLYDPDQENICPGAGGRKLRQVCVYCPNYERWIKRKEKEKGEKKDEKSD